jgi:dsDNA-binding SOS-regulon protein
MGCVAEACNKGGITFANEFDSNMNKTNDETINYSFIKEPQYDQMSKEFFDILNKMRINPGDFIEESKEYNLFEIFIKLKSCPQLNFYDNNMNKIKRYIMRSYLKQKSPQEIEKEVKNLINENLEEVCLFQTLCQSKNNQENVWMFLAENEDDIEKIFDTNYDSLMIIGIPLEHKTKNLLTLAFFKE